MNDDVKARVEAVAQSLAKRLSKNLRDLSDAAAQGRRAFESEFAKFKRANPSFEGALVAASAAGAIVALGVALGTHFLDGSGARFAKLDDSVAAMSRRVNALEQTNNEASATSRAALTALGNRVAAAESALSKSTTLTNSTLAEIQKSVTAQLTQPAPTAGETAAELPALGRLEQRIAALEEKANTHGRPVTAGTAEPADIDHGSGAFPPFESANFAPLLIWLALSFGLLYLLMSKIALPRVENILQARAGKITKDLGEAHAFRAQSEQAAAAHDKTIADARAKALALAQETQLKLNAQADAKRNALEADLNAKLAGAETKIVETKAKAMTHVEEIARDAAAEIVQRITGKPADPKAIAAAIAAKI